MDLQGFCDLLVTAYHRFVVASERDKNTVTYLLRWDRYADDARELAQAMYNYRLSDADVRRLLNSPGALYYKEHKRNKFATVTVLDPDEDVEVMWSYVQAGYNKAAA